MVVFFFFFFQVSFLLVDFQSYLKNNLRCLSHWNKNRTFQYFYYKYLYNISVQTIVKIHMWFLVFNSATFIFKFIWGLLFLSSISTRKILFYCIYFFFYLLSMNLQKSVNTFVKRTLSSYFLHCFFFSFLFLLFVLNIDCMFIHVVQVHIFFGPYINKIIIMKL